MGLFKKKKPDQNAGGMTLGDAMDLNTNSAIENAYQYIINLAQAIGNKQVEKDVKETRLHYQEDCMDLDEVQTTLMALDKYSDAVFEKMSSGDWPEESKLMPVFILSAKDKMEKKKKELGG